MSNENLIGQEAKEKLKEIVNKVDIGMIGTYENNNEFVYAVPMSRQEIDEQGNIWYMISVDHQTCKNVEQNGRVSLLMSDPSSYNFLSLNGKGEIVYDLERVDKYWNQMMEAWFERGKEDPAIRLLKVTPSEAHYWDNKSNKLVTLFKILTASVTGQNLDIGRQGDIHI